jgi:hemoglobin/transferrin/lactoferrin receptor protein
MNWKIILISTASILLLASNPGVAQLRGIVKDNSTGKVLSDVHLSVIGELKGAVTDRSGRFELPADASGREVRVSAIGFSTRTEVVRDSMVVNLVPSVMLLGNDVTITAQRYERNHYDVRESTTVIDGSEFLHSNFRTVPDAFMNSTGVWVQKTNHGGGSPIIRGLMGNQVLLMVDGIRLNNSVFRYGPNQYLNTIDPGSVDRLEAIRGAGSVLYGSDAMGGVVQVLTKAPEFSESPLVSAQMDGKWTSAGMERSARGEVNFSSNRFAIGGSFAHRDFGDLVAGGSIGTLSPSAYNQAAGDAKVLFKVSSRSVFTAAWQNVTQHNVDRYDQVAQGGYSSYYFEPQQRQLAYLRWEGSTPYKMLSSIRATIAYNEFTEGLRSQKANSVSMKDQLDQVYTKSSGLEIRSNPMSGWSFLSGMEYYHDDVSSSAKTTDTETGASMEVRGSYADNSKATNFAAFTSHEFTWGKFTLQSGLRYNKVNVAVADPVFGDQEINPDAFVGNAAVAYRLTPRTQAIISYNSAFRAPNVDDMSKFGPVESNVFEIPSAALNPERSKTYEMSFRTSGPKLSGSIGVYYSSLSDLIDRVAVTWQGSAEVDGRKVYQKQNVGHAEIMGVEMEGEYLISSTFVLFGNVTYTYGQNITKDEPMRRMPPLFGKAGFRYEHKSGVFLRGEVMVAGTQDRLAPGDLSDVRISVRLEDGEMPGWNIVNLYAGYKYKSIQLTTAFRNLFDKGYRVYASGVDGEGRHLSVMLRIAINSRKPD